MARAWATMPYYLLGGAALGTVLYGVMTATGLHWLVWPVVGGSCLIGAGWVTVRHVLRKRS